LDLRAVEKYEDDTECSGRLDPAALLCDERAAELMDHVMGADAPALAAIANIDVARAE
jgi:hypothetical protein